MSKLSTIFHWFLTRWGDAVDRQDYVRAEKVKNTAKKHLEALLKAEYDRGFDKGQKDILKHAHHDAIAQDEIKFHSRNCPVCGDNQ